MRKPITWWMTAWSCTIAACCSCAFISGCASTQQPNHPTTALLMSGNEPAPAEHRVEDRSASLGELAVQEYGETEGARVAADLTPALREAPRPHDAGAAAMVEALAARIARSAPDCPPACIRIAGIRNQSHATEREFSALRQRLASALSPPGADHGLTFIADGDAAYEIVGSAYLISQGGFDQWEMFLALQPVDQAWTIWQGERPIRMLRHPRPGIGEVGW